MDPGGRHPSRLGAGGAFRNPLTASRFPGAGGQNKETPEQHRQPEVSPEVHVFIQQTLIDARGVMAAGLKPRSGALESVPLWGESTRHASENG